MVQKGRREARLIDQFGELGAGVVVLAQRYRETLARIVDRAFEQAREGQSSAPLGAAQFVGGTPAGQRSGDGIGGQRAAPADAGLRPVEFAPDVVAGGAAGVDRQHLAVIAAQQPEAVAADPGHVRIDHGEARRDRDARLHRRAAVAQHR